MLLFSVKNPIFVATVLSKESINKYCQLPVISMSALYLYQLHVYLMKATSVESKTDQQKLGGGGL